MLNIVTQSSVVKPMALVEMGWALVRTSAKDPWQSLKVPFTIGHHTDNDIFVNAPSMRAISRVVLVHEGSLAAVDAQTLDLAPMKDLKLFGIEPICVPMNDTN